MTLGMISSEVPASEMLRYKKLKRRENVGVVSIYKLNYKVWANSKRFGIVRLLQPNLT